MTTISSGPLGLGVWDLFGAIPGDARGLLLELFVLSTIWGNRGSNSGWPHAGQPPTTPWGYCSQSVCLARLVRAPGAGAASAACSSFLPSLLHPPFLSLRVSHANVLEAAQRGGGGEEQDLGEIIDSRKALSEIQEENK